MTIILLIANFWTEYTPLMGSYILSFVGDAAMAAILTQRTVTYKVEVRQNIDIDKHVTKEVTND